MSKYLSEMTDEEKSGLSQEEREVMYHQEIVARPESLDLRRSYYYNQDALRRGIRRKLTRAEIVQQSIDWLKSRGIEVE